MTSLFAWLGQTSPGLYLAASTPAFAAVQSLHLLGLAALGGAVITIDLAAVGAIFRGGAARIARSLAPVFGTGLAVMAVSGLLLVAAGPMKYLSNPLFWPKLLTLGVAVLIHLLLVLVLLRGDPEARGAGVKGVAALSLATWFVVAVLGRWVGLI